MQNKMVVLNIFSSNAPYELIINSLTGRQIKRTIISSYYTKLCIHTNSDVLYLTARYENQIIHRKIIHNYCKCQKTFIPLAFSPNLSQDTLTVFTLTDETYGIPVERAVLTFNQFY